MKYIDVENKIATEYINLLMNDKKDLTLKVIAKKTKIKYQDAILVFPHSDEMNKINFMKIFLSNLDAKVLNLLYQEVKGEQISFYEKLLEGIILRFEELLKYKKAIKKLSFNLNQKIFNFTILFFDNHLFMCKLLTLSGDRDKFIKLNIKAIILNGLFIKSLQNLLIEKNKDLDSTIRKIDNDLKLLFEAKILFKN